MAKAKSSTTKDKTKRPAAAKAAKPAKTVAAAPVETKVTRVSVVPERKTSALGKRLSEQLVIGSLFAELLGTFALTSFLLVILSLSQGAGNPLLSGLAIAGLYLTFARLSGAQLNPAITAGMLVLGKISWLRASGYVLAQITGAIAAYVVINQFIAAYPVNEMTGQAPTLHEVTINAADTWRPFFAEMLGTLVVGFAVAAITLNRKNETEAGLTIGFAFLGGVTIALIGSAAVLNPAVALAVSAYQLDNLWTILQYAAGPIVGVVVGALLYKLLKWDLVGDKKALEE